MANQSILSENDVNKVSSSAQKVLHAKRADISEHPQAHHNHHPREHVIDTTNCKLCCLGSTVIYHQIIQMCQMFTMHMQFKSSTIAQQSWQLWQLWSKSECLARLPASFQLVRERTPRPLRRRCAANVALDEKNLVGVGVVNCATNHAGKMTSAL